MSRSLAQRGLALLEASEAAPVDNSETKRKRRKRKKRASDAQAGDATREMFKTLGRMPGCRWKFRHCA